MIVKLKKRTEPLENKAGGYEIIFWDHKKMIKTYQNSNDALKKRVLELKK